MSGTGGSSTAQDDDVPPPPDGPPPDDDPPPPFPENTAASDAPPPASAGAGGGGASDTKDSSVTSIPLTTHTGASAGGGGGGGTDSKDASSHWMSAAVTTTGGGGGGALAKETKDAKDTKSSVDASSAQFSAARQDIGSTSASMTTIACHSAPVDIGRAQMLYLWFAETPELPWRYAQDCCIGRAHSVALALEARSVQCGKVWLDITGLGTVLRPPGRKDVKWQSHVAAVVYVRLGDGSCVPMVIDPATTTKLVSVDEWVAGLRVLDEFAASDDDDDGDGGGGADADVACTSSNTTRGMTAGSRPYFRNPPRAEGTLSLFEAVDKATISSTDLEADLEKCRLALRSQGVGGAAAGGGGDSKNNTSSSSSGSGSATVVVDE